MELLAFLIGLALEVALHCRVGLTQDLRQARDRARAEAQRQFHELQRPLAQGFYLQGSKCDILHSTDTFTLQHRQLHHYVLSLFAVTPDQRYLHFMSSATGAPYVKELSEQRARLVLKKRWRLHSTPRAPANAVPHASH